MGLDERQQEELKNLIRKRGAIKAALTRVRTFINKFNPREEAITLLQFRQEELPQINKKFDDIQCEIELLDCNNDEEAEKERETFESEYFSIRSAMQEIINSEKNSHNSSLHNSSVNTIVTSHRAALAPISLPQFNGNILEWEPFFDCFKVLVHNEDYYSPAQKFSYLRSTLSGPALDMIKSIPMSEANYEVAIKRLKSRYENKSLVIQTHIRSILDFPSVKIATSGALQELHSHVTTHVAALEALGQPVDHWDAWLITVVLRKLDTATIHAWQLKHTTTELPTYVELETFLASRCVAFESSETWENNAENNSDKLKSTITKKSNFMTGVKKSLAVSKSSVEQRCICCTDTHRLYMCNKFKEMEPSKRAELVRENRLCFNCLSPYHRVESCKSQFSCQKCKKRHNTLIHFERGDKNEVNIEDKSVASTSYKYTDDTTKTSLMAQQAISHVFLATASVLIRDNFGNQRKCRVVLDSGSQVNFISKKTANLLQLPAKKACLPISGIGAQQVRAASYVDVSIQSRTSDYQVDLVCYVLPNMVTDLASCSEPKEGWKIPGELAENLADPDFYHRRSVDLLIGGGVFFDILGTERRMIGTGQLSLQDSCFGWIVTGELEVSCMLGINSVGEELEESWKAELNNESPNFGRSSKSNQKCVEEQETVEHFKQNTVRDEEGRFVVRLPTKDSVSELGSTLAMATSRFFGIERRLERDDNLKKEYTQFMEEYIKLGHMRETTEDLRHKQVHFYLPHHAVVKPSSITTKVRVVFDASAKSTSGLSLNQVLKCGPTVQKDLFSILIRFRKHQVVITADVEKMFRQIKVAREDWSLQQILWRSNPKELLRTYNLTTITYGTTPASFLSTYCLITLAEEFKQSHPKASKAIMEDFYMDDLITGTETEEECSQLQRDICMILDSARLPLRKWCSNSAVIQQKLSERESDPLFALDIKDGDLVNSLGLQWKPLADQFQFNITPRTDKMHLTKRMILSDLNRIFDPLGFISPVLIKGKIFLQQMWTMKMGWDTKLPKEIQEKWINFYSELDQLKLLRIPRKVKRSFSEITEVHGFCDASEEAYGANVYIRSYDAKGNWNARILCSKTRVAPTKGITIPRLELNSALLLAELIHKVANSWEIKPQCFRLWTDSTVVLGWLNSQNTRLKTYVNNRVTQILDLSEVSQWCHVRSKENPADICSRGLRVPELLNASLWWNGPEWLSRAEETWEGSLIQPVQENELPEIRPLHITLIGIDPSRDLISRYSNWRKLVRAIAWLRRFVEYLRQKRTGRWPQYIMVPEIIAAEKILIKRTQEESFGKEIIALTKGLELPRKSKLKSLCPYMDNGLILVGGRLQNAHISKEQRNPAVLPASHTITRLIYLDRHQQMLHCGPQLLLAEVRRTYWPIRGRAMARSITSRCVICKRANPKFDQPVMGQLPKQRVQYSRPFTVTGVDFAGPLTIRSGIRGKPGRKAWISIFVCFSTRAVHIEAVEDLTTSAFIAALRRFIARRGKPNTVWSDNGTNFIGAQRELSTYLKNIDGCLASEGINWKFNPPAAPHFGGIWESAVKSAKFHLTRIVRGSTLTLSELQTLLCQIEACLNCRPLTPISSDPNDFESITPAHFLIGGSLMFHPEPVIDETELTSLKRWKLVQGLLQSFWKRWHAEYLPQLQVRGKWTSGTEPLVVNDIVIVKEDNIPPSKWKLARVVKVHPGKDSVVRVATIKLPNGSELSRPVVKLCRLPNSEVS